MLKNVMTKRVFLLAISSLVVVMALGIQPAAQQDDGDWTRDGVLLFPANPESDMVILTTPDENVGTGVRLKLAASPDRESQFIQGGYIHPFWMEYVGHSNEGHAVITQAGPDETRRTHIRAVGITHDGSLGQPGALILQEDGGNVGIATTSPVARLDVRGDVVTDSVFGFSSIQQAAPQFGVYISAPASQSMGLFTMGQERIRIDAAGNVGIGTTSPDVKLDVAGVVRATRFQRSSDARLKINITPLTDVLEKLRQIRGVSFEWNDVSASLGYSTGQRDIGVIAQEVEAVFPELVTTSGAEGYLAVDYGRLTSVIIEAVKELQAENIEAVKELRAENDELRAQLGSLKRMITEFKDAAGK